MKTNNVLILGEHMEVVAQHKVVQLRFRVSDAADGRLLQEGDDLFYLHGSRGGVFPKVEKALEGCRVGDAGILDLTPAEGFGERDPALLVRLPAAKFLSEMPAAGELVQARLPDGRAMMFSVRDVTDREVVLDGNQLHAGKRLRFEFEVLGLRDSTPAERTAGFAFSGALPESR